jgi:hypothetical protein
MLCVVSAGMAACAKAQARVPTPPAPLAAPPPPPRTHIPVTLPVPEPPPPPPAPPAEPPPIPDTGTRPGGTGKTPEKPQAPPPAPEPTQAILQTGDSTELEKQVRALLDSAKRNLSLVKKQELSQGAKDQYDTANRFVRLAESAMNSKNFVYANQLADNAHTLARLLIKR